MPRQTYGIELTLREIRFDEVVYSFDVLFGVRLEVFIEDETHVGVVPLLPRQLYVPPVRVE